MKRAKLSIKAIRIDCPHCGEGMLSDDQDYEMSEAVYPTPGPIDCEHCQKEFLVPELANIWRERTVLR